MAAKPWVGILSQWVTWKVEHLAQFLDGYGPPAWLWQRGAQAPQRLAALAGIGYKQSSAQARLLCQRWGVPYIALEDGFLRSSSLGVEGDTPLSMVVDPVGIHYLASQPSALENLLQQPQQLTEAELREAEALMALMRASGIGKYNHAPDLPAHDPLGQDRPLVLVVDQTWGDFSISGGGLNEAAFADMLDAALAENPGCEVRVRIHPDCAAGYKKSCLLAAAQARGVALETRLVSWSSLVRRAQRVYVGTSQAGLEALIEGVPVTCWGLPFYAGWGLTDDRLACPRRQGRPTLVQLVAAAYLRYCRYVNPRTGQLTNALTVARQLAERKALDTLLSGTSQVVGVPWAQRRRVRALLRSRWGELAFSAQPAAAAGQRLLAWPGAPLAAPQAPVWPLQPHADGLYLQPAGQAPLALLHAARSPLRQHLTCLNHYSRRMLGLAPARPTAKD